ncbi:MAG: PAS domain-containing protein, partial [Alphaproteobacteria bacterium]|nr:PAS domain-containing protein [Alphaproteobacteria bacterium]
TELRSKLATVGAANSDLQNLMQATEIATLFVDTGLRIRLFTPRIAALFKVTDADVGRAITDFTHRLVDVDLEADAAHVLRDQVALARDVATGDHRWLTMRLRPYRTLDDRIDGLVVTFVDVTERRRSEETLRWTRDQLALATAAAGFGWATWDLVADVLECDPRARAILDLEDATTGFADWAARIHPDDRARVEREVAAAVEEGGRFENTHRLVRRDGDVRRVESNAVFQRDATGRVVRASGLVRDVTERGDADRE